MFRHSLSLDSLRALAMNVTFLLLSELREIALVLVLLLQYASQGTEAEKSEMNCANH